MNCPKAMKSLRRRAEESSSPGSNGPYLTKVTPKWRKRNPHNGEFVELFKGGRELKNYDLSLIRSSKFIKKDSHLWNYMNGMHV